MTLVYPNFEAHPERAQRLREKFRANGLELAGDRPEQARYLLNKTRCLDGALLARFPSLEAVVVLGPEAWMVRPGARELDVMCLDEERGYEVAEHAIALLLLSLKGFGSSELGRLGLSPRRWARMLRPQCAGEVSSAHNWSGAVSGTLYGRRVGIVGYGLIGHAIRRRLSGFGAELHYHSRCPYPAEVEQALGISHLALEPMFERCDAVFLQLPLSESTEGLVGARVLERVRPGFVLVNCGRAGVVVEDDLLAALREGRLRYAADVAWQEPLPLWSPFRRLEACLITPHMAESLKSRRHTLYEEAMQAIIAREEQLRD